MGEYIGTPGCEASSGPCGKRLNRCKRVKPVSLAINRPITLARPTFTRVSGGGFCRRKAHNAERFRAGYE